jgi:4-hydroxy-3-polyprenylbenzoate decarboxylase
LDEFTFAGLLQGVPLNIVRSRNGDLPIPAGAELVIEGFIDPGALVGDGAFGNHTGYYVPSDESPLVRITSVSRRHDMILPATIVGPPPMEDCWLAAAAGMLMLPLLQVDIPSIVGIHQPFAGIFHGAAIVSLNMTIVDDRCELFARLWEAPWFAKARFLVVVDAEQDPADTSGVCWRVMNNVVWERDLLIDGERFGIDATRKPDDGRVALKMDEETVRLVESRWREYGFDDGR